MLKDGYYITLLGEDKDIEQYKTVADGIADIIKYDDLWYLSNDTIRNAHNCNEPEKIGEELLNMIHGLWTLYGNTKLHVEISGVVMIKDSGGSVHICRDVDFDFEVIRDVTASEKQLIKELLVMAVTDSSIQEVLFYLKDGIPNFFNGFKITEIISADVNALNNKNPNGISVENLFGGKKQYGDLRMNYNLKELQGVEARHASEKKNAHLHKAKSKDELWKILKFGIKNWFELKKKQ